MLSIARAHERLLAFSSLDRSGKKAIQLQTVFAKTMSLSDDEIVDVNISGLQYQYLESLIKRDDFTHLVDLICNSYEKNLPELQQFFSFREFVEPFNNFAKSIQVDIPPLDSFQLELRPAQVFSHSLYYFVKDHEKNADIESKARTLLAEYDLPAEMINLTFSCIDPMNFKQLTHTLTVLSLILREAALEAGFVPGRSIGTLNTITE